MTAVTATQAATLARKAKRSALEDKLASDLDALGVPAPVREWRFHATRRWRFDFAWPVRKLAVEVDGGTWSGGRHTTGSGYQRDAEKGNAASRLGWRVLHYTGSTIRSGEAAREIAEVLNG